MRRYKYIFRGIEAKIHGTVRTSNFINRGLMVFATKVIDQQTGKVLKDRLIETRTDRLREFFNTLTKNTKFYPDNWIFKDGKFYEKGEKFPEK